MRSSTWRLLAGTVAVVALVSGCGGGASTSSSASGAAAGQATSQSNGGGQDSSTGLRPSGETASGVPVLRVVDGDTLHVLLDGRDTTVRLIGMNTPETVKEGTPVECYGPEASDYAKKTLDGATVTLEFDASQGRTDQYGRTLAYVWLEKGDGSLTLVNLDEIDRGLARERQYGPTPYAWKDTFRTAQKRAKSAGVGLWGACPT